MLLLSYRTRMSYIITPRLLSHRYITNNNIQKQSCYRMMCITIISACPCCCLRICQVPGTAAVRAQFLIDINMPTVRLERDNAQFLQTLYDKTPRNRAPKALGMLPLVAKLLEVRVASICLGTLNRFQAFHTFLQAFKPLK